MDGFHEVKFVGSGSFGRVYRGIEYEWVDGQRVGVERALKYVGLQNENDIMKEAAVLLKNECEHIIHLHSIKKSKCKRYLILVLDYCPNGSLQDNFVYYRKNLSEAYKIFRQTFAALQYIHEKSLVHRDIKPENILVDEKMDIKIADFGVSKSLAHMMANTEVGSPYFMSPDVSEGRYDYKADVWSACATFYKLFAGQAPYDVESCTNSVQAYHYKTDISRYEALSPAQCPSDPIRHAINFNLTHKQAERHSSKQVLDMLDSISVPSPGRPATALQPSSTKESKLSSYNIMNMESVGASNVTKFNAANESMRVSALVKPDIGYDSMLIDNNKMQAIIDVREIEENDQRLQEIYDVSTYHLDASEKPAQNRLQNSSMVLPPGASQSKLLSVLPQPVCSPQKASEAGPKGNPYSHHGRGMLDTSHSVSREDRRQVKVVTDSDEEGPPLARLQNSDDDFEEDPDYWNKKEVEDSLKYSQSSHPEQKEIVQYFDDEFEDDFEDI